MIERGEKIIQRDMVLHHSTSFNILNLSVLLVDEFLDYGETDLFVFCLYFRWHCSWLITSYIRKYPKHMNLGYGTPLSTIL
jgi:hypothetical protein